MFRGLRFTGLIILVLIFLSSSFTSPAFARERFRLNARLDTGEENASVEFEYDLNYRVSISGGLGITILDTGNSGTASLGFRYYLSEPGHRLYLKVRGLTKFYDSYIRFRIGFGFGYTAYVSGNRGSIELELLVGSISGTLEIKPSIGISVGIR